MRATPRFNPMLWSGGIDEMDPTVITGYPMLAESSDYHWRAVRIDSGRWRVVSWPELRCPRIEFTSLAQCTTFINDPKAQKDLMPRACTHKAALGTRADWATWTLNRSEADG